MNRAERRRQEKAQGKTYTLTRYDIAYQEGYQKGLQDAAYERVCRTIRIYTTAIMATLYNECGFGRKRMQRVLDHFTETLKRLYADRSVEPKLRAYVKQKTKIDPDDFTGARKLDINEEINQMIRMGTMVTPKLSSEDIHAVAEAVGKEIDGWA